MRKEAGVEGHTMAITIYISLRYVYQALTKRFHVALERWTKIHVNGKGRQQRGSCDHLSCLALCIWFSNDEVTYQLYAKCKKMRRSVETAAPERSMSHESLCCLHLAV